MEIAGDRRAGGIGGQDGGESSAGDAREHQPAGPGGAFGEGVRQEHVIEAFQRHLGQAGPDGVAVFYYSGHGMQFNANVALTGAMDPEPSGVDQALYMWSDNGNGGMLLDDEIGYLASRLRTDRVLIVSDACFSGSGTRGGEGGQTKEQKFDDVKGGLTIPSQGGSMDSMDHAIAAR